MASSIQAEEEHTAEHMDDELGYFYLEDCDVYLSSSFSIDGSEWMDVQVPTAVSPLQWELSTDPKACDKIRDCSHCKLVVRRFKQEPSLCLVGDGPRFDGTIDDAQPDPTLCSCKTRQRSDAALLMGLALTCQDLGHISIKSIRIAFASVSSQPEILSQGCKTNDEIQSESPRNDPCRRTAALIITFSTQEVTPHLPRNRKSSKSQKPKRRLISASLKPLPPPTQLLLNLLRSDWDALDIILRNPQKPLTQYRYKSGRPCSLFPPRISLDEVYRRIGGAASVLLEEEEIGQPTYAVNKKERNFTNLPKDVLKYHLAVFLRARSLDSLRCTCRFLHKTLRSSIPGLKLSLYAHQQKSLAWMRTRETKQLVENHFAIHQSNMQCRDHRTLGDCHRAASGGASVVLCPRHKSQGENGNEIRISQYNGDEIMIRPDDPLSRRLARGGLLCDDPGLGKTITVLSLILQTLGLSTEPVATDEEKNDSEEDETSDENIFAEYWREQSIPEFRSQALNKLLSEFMRISHDVDHFVYPVDPKRDGCPDYFDIIQNPICFRDIRRKVNGFAYGDSFDSFQSDVELCFSNAMLYNPPENEVYKAAFRSNELFREKVGEFKQKQIHVAKKSFARASAKPNSAVAALVERNNRLKLKNSLVPSSGTLLVVPSVLLEHWQEQLKLHVNPAYCTNKIPLIFEYSGTGSSGLQMEQIMVQCQVEKTHFPFIFIDTTNTKKLPSPHFLAMFSIVITTNQRFTNEWKNGSFEDELKQKSNEGTLQNSFDLRNSLTESEEACPLLKVSWLRMIVDEGHSMGRGKDNSAISFASWVAAERRWATTGTPTRQTISQSGLSNILNLMQYLQHEFFRRRQDGEIVWQNLVTRYWGQGHYSAFFRLRSLLTLLMVRHTKLDIEELPPPRYQTTVLPMSAMEVQTYNTLVCAVQSNLVITQMEGKTSGKQDSLLHRSQAKHAKEALRNVRLVCSGGTLVCPTITDSFWKEFLEDFAACNSSQEKRTEMRKYLSRAVTEQLSPCECCGMMLSTLLVFPCGDLVCTECVDHNATSCVVCDKTFDVDLFQRLQPGFDYQWLHNIEEESKKKKNKNHVRSEEEDVVQLPAGAGMLAPFDADRHQRQRTRKPGDGHECKYSPKFTNGECELCWKEHEFCNLMTNSRCKVCYRQAENCPSSETKSFYVVQKLMKLYEANKQRQASMSKGMVANGFLFREKRPLKIIVFSQFRKVLNLTGDRLLRRFGTACIAEYWGKFRKQELSKFIHDDECFCMLLGKDGSEGLDLSFVTHIFFLEQVWDKSLEQQAVARAWRMGAKGSVEVETLVAENSVEQTMSRLEQKLEEDTDEGISLDDIQGIQMANEAEKISEYQRAKLQFLLRGLKLITNAHTTSFGTAKRKELTATEDTYTIRPPANKKPRKLRVRFQNF